jgi:NADH-quinone oxidoreductase subunit H
LASRSSVQTAGKGGLLQPLADGLKLFAKEEFEPDTPNRFFVFYRSRDCDDYCFNDKLYPWGSISSFGKDIILQATDIDVALLTLLAQCQ